MTALADPDESARPEDDAARDGTREGRESADPAAPAGPAPADPADIAARPAPTAPRAPAPPSGAAAASPPVPGSPPAAPPPSPPPPLAPLVRAVDEEAWYRDTFGTEDPGPAEALWRATIDPRLPTPSPFVLHAAAEACGAWVNRLLGPARGAGPARSADRGGEGVTGGGVVEDGAPLAPRFRAPRGWTPPAAATAAASDPPSRDAARLPVPGSAEATAALAYRWGCLAVRWYALRAAAEDGRTGAGAGDGWDVGTGVGDDAVLWRALGCDRDDPLDDPGESFHASAAWLRVRLILALGPHPARGRAPGDPLLDPEWVRRRAVVGGAGARRAIDRWAHGRTPPARGPEVAAVGRPGATGTSGPADPRGIPAIDGTAGTAGVDEAADPIVGVDEVAPAKVGTGGAGAGTEHGPVPFPPLPLLRRLRALKGRLAPLGALTAAGIVVDPEARAWVALRSRLP